MALTVEEHPAWREAEAAISMGQVGHVSRGSPADNAETPDRLLVAVNGETGLAVCHGPVGLVEFCVQVRHP